MKSKFKVIAGLMSVSLLCSACAAGSDNKKIEKPKSNYKEAAYQGQLNALRPSAYGEVNGLDLEPGTTISVIGKGTGTDYWKAVEKGARQAVEDLNEHLGYKGNDKIKVVYSGCSEGEDVEEQVNILDEEMARYPAALAIAIIDEKACSVQFDLAAENDLPIVVFDSGSDYQGIVCMISTNNRDAGKTAGTKLASALEGKGEVALFLADQKSMSSAQREEGIKEAFTESYPDIKVVDTYHGDELAERSRKITDGQTDGGTDGTKDGTTPADGDAAKDGTTPANGDAAKDGTTPADADAAKAGTTPADGGTAKDDAAGKTNSEEEPSMTQLEMVKAILEAHPDLKGCVTGSEEMTELLLKAADELDRDDLKIVGFDTGEKQMEALEEGKLSGLIVQNPFGMGYASVVAGARAVLGQANEANVDSGYTWVTKDNMEKESIQKMLY